MSAKAYLLCTDLPGCFSGLPVIHCSIANTFKTKVFIGNTGNCLFKVNYTAFLQEVESGMPAQRCHQLQDPIELIASFLDSANQWL